MTVIFFNPYADPSVKGASRRIAFLRHMLDLQGQDSRAILAEDYRYLPRGLVERLFLKAGLRRFSYFLQASRLCNAPDNIVISEVIFTPTWRRNMILTVHDLKAYDRRAARGGGRAADLRRYAYVLFTRLAKRIVVVSQSVRDDLRVHCAVPAERILVIPNGISQDRLELATATMDRFAAGPKRFDFIYISSFVRHKRQDMLIRQAPAGSRICLVGRDMGALPDIMQAIADRSDAVTVEIRNDVDTDSELFDLIGLAHCGVFPSVFEGFGIPILEYAAAGLHVIASDIPPFRELADHIDQFVAPDDEVAWHQALERVFVEAPAPSRVAAAKVRASNFTEAAISEQFRAITRTKP